MDQKGPITQTWAILVINVLHCLMLRHAQRGYISQSVYFSVPLSICPYDYLFVVSISLSIPDSVSQSVNQ